MFHTVYVSICVTFCALSILFDSILTKIARERAGRVGVYRYFTYSFVITDIVYSISYALTAPTPVDALLILTQTASYSVQYWHSAPGVLVFFAASPLWEYYSLMKISMLVWWMSYVTILLCLASSFLYRYGLLCNTAVLEIFTTPWKTKTFLVSSFALFTVWMTLATQIIFHSEDELREDLQAGLDSAPFHVNFSAVYCLGVNIKKSDAVQVEIGSILLLALMFASFACIIYCGYKIHETVVHSIMSDKSRMMHAAALRMIIAQALNPTIFLYMPGSINMIGFVTASLPLITRRLFVCLFGLFPVVNPLIIVYFTDDYKRLLLGKSTGSSTQNNRRSKKIRLSSSRLSITPQPMLYDVAL